MVPELPVTAVRLSLRVVRPCPPMVLAALSVQQVVSVQVLVLVVPLRSSAVPELREVLAMVAWLRLLVVLLVLALRVLVVLLLSQAVQPAAPMVLVALLLLAAVLALVLVLVVRQV